MLCFQFSDYVRFVVYFRPAAKQLTWSAWKCQHNGTQDEGSVIGSQHPFADSSWAETLNVSLRSSILAKEIGWQHIDTSTAGLTEGNL